MGLSVRLSELGHPVCARHQGQSLFWCGFDVQERMTYDQRREYREMGCDHRSLEVASPVTIADPDIECNQCGKFARVLD